jgi:uncharacterized membrane protein YidH (DUF202 family)
MRVQSKAVIPGAVTMVGVYFAVLGVSKYGIWDSVKGPLAGFFPMVIGVALVVTGILNFFQMTRDKEPLFEKKNWLIVLGVLFIIVGNYIFGLLPSLLIFIVAWLRFVEKSPWKKVLLPSAVMFGIIYCLFALWLQVPFEKGMILSMLIK